MNDYGNAIEIDVSGPVINIFEESQSNGRYLLGYISGEFYKIKTSGELFITVYYKRNTDMQWESVTFKLNKDDKIFKQKLPPGILAVCFYIRLYGYAEELELTSLRISVKEIPIGKYGGKPLQLMEIEEQPEPPSFSIIYTPFEIKVPLAGEVTANSVKVVWATTHRAKGRVVYGLSPENLSNEVRNDEYEFYHDELITGLELEQIYYCRIYSTSEQTKQEISSELMAFSTGKEITFQNIFGITNIEYIVKDKLNKNVNNILYETETFLTSEPEADVTVNNYASLSVLNKSELNALNKIGNEFDYTVTP